MRHGLCRAALRWELRNIRRKKEEANLLPALMAAPPTRHPFFNPDP